MNPRSDDHFDHTLADPASDLTLGADVRSAAAPIDDDRPFNMSMYLDFLPGTD